MSMTIQEAIKHLGIHLRADADCYNQAVAKGYYVAAEGHKRDAEVHQIAIAALREKAERENPIPLTIEDLLQMDEELVWLEVIDDQDYTVPNESEWAQVVLPKWKRAVWFWRFGNECESEPKMENYGKTWICYRHKPKEVQK